MPTPPTTPASPALSELMEELGRIYWKACTGSALPLAERIQYQKEIDLIFAKTYAAGVKAGLMEAKELMPRGHGWGRVAPRDEVLSVYGWNAYRTEFLARLNEKINSLK